MHQCNIYSHSCFGFPIVLYSLRTPLHCYMERRNVLHCTRAYFTQFAKMSGYRSVSANVAFLYSVGPVVLLVINKPNQSCITDRRRGKKAAVDYYYMCVSLILFQFFFHFVFLSNVKYMKLHIYIYIRTYMYNWVIPSPCIFVYLPVALIKRQMCGDILSVACT